MVLLGELAIGARDLFVGRTRGRARAPCSSPCRTTRVRPSSPFDFHHGRTQNHALPAIPGAQTPRRRSGPFALVVRRVRDGVVHLGIEGHAHASSMRFEPFFCRVSSMSPRAWLERRRLVVSRPGEVGLGVVEGVEHRQQLGDDVARRSSGRRLRGCAALACGSSRIGLETLERVEVLVALALGLGSGRQTLRWRRLRTPPTRCLRRRRSRFVHDLRVDDVVIVAGRGRGLVDVGLRRLPRRDAG